MKIVFEERSHWENLMTSYTLIELYGPQMGLPIGKNMCIILYLHNFSFRFIDSNEHLQF